MIHFFGQALELLAHVAKFERGKQTWFSNVSTPFFVHCPVESMFNGIYFIYFIYHIDFNDCTDIVPSINFSAC